MVSTVTEVRAILVLYFNPIKAYSQFSLKCRFTTPQKYWMKFSSQWYFGSLIQRWPSSVTTSSISDFWVRKSGWKLRRRLPQQVSVSYFGQLGVHAPLRFGCSKPRSARMTLIPFASPGYEDYWNLDRHRDETRLIPFGKRTAWSVLVACHLFCLFSLFSPLTKFCPSSTFHPVGKSSINQTTLGFSHLPG